MIDSHISFRSAQGASRDERVLTSGLGRLGMPVLRILLLVICPLASLMADIKVAPARKVDRGQQERLIPVPVELNVRVVRGADAEFVVRAPTPSPKRVEFIVRRGPAVGGLEGPMVVDGDKHAARFRYTSPADSEENLVVVEIAARLPGEGISKAIPMRILVEDAVAILETKPKMVRFEKAVVGKPTRYSPVEVTNIGNAVFEGELSFPLGWSAHNLDGEIRIAPGETHRFGLRFLADNAGFFDEVQYLQPGVKESGLHLVVEAIRVLAVTPGKLVLEWDEETQTRRGKLSFHNRDDVAWTLYLWGNDRMEMPAQVHVRPRSIATAEIVIPPGDIEPLESRLQAKSGSLKIGVTVEAAATPARVAIVYPADGIVDFGETSRDDEELVRSVIFDNSGGTAAPITLRPVPPFSVVGGADGIEVLGGARRLVHLTAESSTAGRFDRVLVARAGGAELPLKVRFRVAAPDAIVIDTGVQGIVLKLNEPEQLLSLADIEEMDGSLIFEDLEKVPEELTERMAREAFYGISPFDSYFRNDLPKVGELHPVEATRGSVTFGFEPIEGAFSYVVEMGTVVYHPKTRLLTKEWRGLKKKDLRLSSHPGEVRVTMRGIPAGAGRELRVFAIFPGREFGRPCPPVFFQTLPPLKIPWGKLAVAFGVVVLLLGVLAYRNPDRVEDWLGSWTGSFLAGLRPSRTRGQGGLRPAQGKKVEEEFEILPAKKKVAEAEKPGRKKTDTQKLELEDSPLVPVGGWQSRGKVERKKTDTQKIELEDSPLVPVGGWRSRGKVERKKTDTQKLDPEVENGADGEDDPFMPGEIPKL